MIAWLKAIHIVALMVWCAGLLTLPGLYVRRGRVASHAELHELQRFTRALFIGIVSPAAFVTVIAGTSLIFLNNVFNVWMMAKLALVGALVALHMREGYLVLHIFEPRRRYPRWKQIGTLAATIGVILSILYLVLAKPHLDLAGFPDWLRKPGGLQSLLETMSPMP